MRKLYHGTSTANLASILSDGIRPSLFEQAVYLTDSAESAARWVGFKLSAIGESQVSVIEVEVDDELLSEGCDHSPIMQTLFGCGESLLYPALIESSQILNVMYYEIKKTKD